MDGVEPNSSEKRKKPFDGAPLMRLLGWSAVLHLLLDVQQVKQPQQQSPFVSYRVQTVNHLFRLSKSKWADVLACVAAK